LHPLSVVIITFNEEQNIRRCIRSVKGLADEIIVLDSFSTDRTIEIAREMGAIVHQENFRGYIGQKNTAMWLATNDFILSLDADEELDNELASAITKAKENLSFCAYTMNRCTCYCEHFIRHGLWYPDKKIRLFDRRVAEWGGRNPHDKILLRDKVKVSHLPGDILHYSFNNPEDLIWQNNRMSSIAAASLYANGVRSSWFKLFVRPTWAFFRGYVLRFGFLDGFDGFTIAIHTANQVFMKYARLRRFNKTRQKPGSKPLEKPREEMRKVAADR
jgi:glycosyltransferase involved in cell wall biosynthesis